MPDSADIALRARAVAGDDAAFAELVEPRQGSVFRHCYRMLGSGTDAEDATQDTLERAWRNLFENPKTVQFVHRCGAYLVWIVALAYMIFPLSRAPKTTHARRASLLFLLVTLQAALGITTLLMQVPIDLGLAHQAMALVVLAFATAHWRGTKGAYPVEAAPAPA